MTKHGLVQRVFTLLPQICSIDNDTNLIIFTHQGQADYEKFVDELQSSKEDLNIFHLLLMHVFNHTHKEAEMLMSEEVEA